MQTIRTSIIHVGRAWVAVSLVFGGWYGCLVVGREGWFGHEHKAQRTVVCLLVRRYEALSFFQSLRVLAPYAALGCYVFFSFFFDLLVSPLFPFSLHYLGWKELIHMIPRSKPLGACAVRWIAGWTSYVFVLCYHPATTKHQGPSDPRTTYLCIILVRTSPGYCIMYVF